MTKFNLLVGIFAPVLLFNTWSEVKAEAIKMTMPSDFVLEGQEGPDFLAGKLLIELQTYLEGKVEFELKLASRSREWRLLEQRDDICLYNKTKTPERQVHALYSNLPLVVYPPNRLIVRRTVGDFTDRIEMSQAVEKYGLVLGVVSGRSYGAQVDREITRLSNKLYFNGGEFNASRLQKILLNNRIDGVIEYTNVFLERLDDPRKMADFKVLKLDEAEAFSLGFIACSRSKQGEQVIALINRALESNLMKERILLEHQKTFPGVEYQFIKQELEFLWHSQHLFKIK